MTRRRIVAAAALLAAFVALGARADEPRKYGVLSIIGDRMLIVSHRGETGTRVDQGRRDFIDMPPRVLDNGVLGGMKAAIEEADRGSDVVMLGASPALYAAQVVTEDPDIGPVLDMVREPLRKAGVTHLVLVSKLRHDAMLRFADGYFGTGKLEGVGFYMDHALLTRNTEGTEHGQGFLAPFAYFRVWLVNLRGGEVLGQRDVLASQSVTAGRSPSLQVWESLTGAEKARIISVMTRTETARAVREILRKQ